MNRETVRHDLFAQRLYACDSTSPIAGLELLDQYIAERAFGDATRVVDVLIAAHPNDVDVLRSALQVSIANHDAVRARLFSCRLVEAAPDRLDVRAERVLVLGRLGLRAEAEVELEQLLQSIASARDAGGQLPQDAIVHEARFLTRGLSFVGADIPDDAPEPEDAQKDTEPGCLFVSGLPRSGTTALGNLLNLSPQIQLFNELYPPFHVYEPADFTPSALRKMLGFQSNSKEDKQLRTDLSGARWIGDKRPQFHFAAGASLLRLANHKVTVVHIVRDLSSIARSYDERALDATDPAWGATRNGWEALFEGKAVAEFLGQLVRKRLRAHHRLMFVQYEEIFSRQDVAISMFENLGVDITDALRAEVTEFQASSTSILDRANPQAERYRELFEAWHGLESVNRFKSVTGFSYLS
jgi:hypothetical protein